MEAYFEFTITCDEDTRDLLIAELAEEGYEGFIENDHGFSAYVPQSKHNMLTFNDVLLKYGINPDSVPHSTIEQQNWNAQWEANYEPIIVADRIMVRAPFHEAGAEYEHVITIQPKNTFGTGHHETTQLMLELMLEQDFHDKKVFDYGCGTGVLGLMALKFGAAYAVGNDIDEWCLDNIAENKQLNNLTDFEFRLGDLSVLDAEEQFDVVLANINKNILLRSFTQLSKHIKPGGKLLISGFYEADLNDLVAGAAGNGLSPVKHITKNEWCSALLIKE